MVLVVKKDPSSDVCYSSLEQDARKWESSHGAFQQAPRFNYKTAVDQRPLTEPSADLAIHKSKRVYANMKSTTERFASLSTSSDAAEVLVPVPTDPRLMGQKSSPALGPGAYDAELALDKHGPGHGSDPSRPSAAFRSPPRRTFTPPPNYPDVSNAAQRNTKEWTARGFPLARYPRFTDVAGWKERTGELLPAFHHLSELDVDRATTASLEPLSPTKTTRRFTSSPKRTLRLPLARTLRDEVTATNEYIDGRFGPGYYDTSVADPPLGKAVKGGLQCFRGPGHLPLATANRVVMTKRSSRSRHLMI